LSGRRQYRPTDGRRIECHHEQGRKQVVFEVRPGWTSALVEDEQQGTQVTITARHEDDAAIKMTVRADTREEELVPNIMERLRLEGDYQLVSTDKLRGVRRYALMDD
jgi:hypothetical protein